MTRPARPPALPRPINPDTVHVIANILMGHLKGSNKAMFDAACATLEAIAFSEAMLTAQPIDTLPQEYKDGRKVLLRFEHENFEWSKAGDRHMWEQITTAEWIDNMGSEGWTWNGLAGRMTHWWAEVPA